MGFTIDNPQRCPSHSCRWVNYYTLLMHICLKQYSNIIFLNWLPYLWKDATIKSGAEMFPLTENSKHSTDAISSINGSGSKSVNRTPDGSSKDWIPFKYSGNRNWPSLVMTNDHTNDSEKMRSYDNSNNSVREQNYSLTGKKLASGYDERSGLAMRSLYLALLNHRLNSGKQFVSMRHYGATDWWN